MPNKIEREIEKDRKLEQILKVILELKEEVNEWKESQSDKKAAKPKQK